MLHLNICKMLITNVNVNNCKLKGHEFPVLLLNKVYIVLITLIFIMIYKNNKEILHVYI